MSGESREKPRIIIDEDWKAQAQREKEALAEKLKRDSPAGPHPELPPASLAVLATSLATQALAALGQVPEPGTNRVERRLDEARHLIDLLQVLQDKTRGNVTPDESMILEDLLHQLRLAYVTVSTAPAVAAEGAGGPD